MKRNYFNSKSRLKLFDFSHSAIFSNLQQYLVMGSYSIGEALKLMMEKSHWAPKVTELRMRQEWEEIVGKTIAKYTRNINLYGKVLTIYTDVAPLKQELLLGKEQLAIRINEYFKDKVVTEIVIK